MERILKYLQDAGMYFLATEEGDQPRVRPFGTQMLYEGRLYIQTGKKKPVSKQLAANPKAEISASVGGTSWIRITGELAEDDRVEAKKAMLDLFPELRGMYDENDPNTQVLYFKSGEAVICSFTEPPVKIEF